MAKLWAWLMSFFSGAGSVAGAVGEVAKLGSKAVDEFHDAKQREAGALAVTTKVQEKTIDTVQKVADARSDPDNMRRVHDASSRD